MNATLDAIDEELARTELELSMLLGVAAQVAWFRDTVIVKLLPRDYREDAWDKFDFIHRKSAVRTPVSVWTGLYNGRAACIMLYALGVGPMSFAVGNAQTVSLKSIAPVALPSDPASALAAVKKALTSIYQSTP